MSPSLRRVRTVGTIAAVVAVGLTVLCLVWRAAADVGAEAATVEANSAAIDELEEDVDVLEHGAVRTDTNVQWIRQRMEQLWPSKEDNRQ